MTHRNPRRRRRNPASANLTDAFREPFAAGVALAANPNGGKRHASPATTRVESAATDERPARGRMTPNESRRISDARTSYVPLTVHTPIKRARKAPRTTSYTI